MEKLAKIGIQILKKNNSPALQRLMDISNKANSARDIASTIMSIF